MSGSKATQVAVVALAALVLGACGGDDEEATTAPTTPEVSGATGATGPGGVEKGTGAAVASAIEDDNRQVTVEQCPETVTLEEGEEFDCDFTTEEKGQEVSGTLTVTVDSADEDTVTISYKAKGKATEPGPVRSVTLFGYKIDVEK